MPEIVFAAAAMAFMSACRIATMSSSAETMAAVIRTAAMKANSPNLLVSAVNLIDEAVWIW
jgi:hypothetical protein